MELVQVTEMVDEYVERSGRLRTHLDASVDDDVEDRKEPQADVAEVGGKVQRFRHLRHLCGENP